MASFEMERNPAPSGDFRADLGRFRGSAGDERKSRRKRRGRGPSGAATSARSADSLPLRGRGFPEPPKWGQRGRPGGKARGSRENRGVPEQENRADQQSVVKDQTATHGCRDTPVTGATAAQMLLYAEKEKASPSHQKSFSKRFRRG